jgi:LuxR family maltose regulon positive regulatory protein
MGALVCALTGDPTGVERWTVAGEALTPIARLARAVQTSAGTAAMIEDTRTALEELPPGSGFRPAATLMEGLGRLWEGEVERADALFAEAVSLSEPHGATPTATLALVERAVIAIEGGDWSTAEEWASQSLRLVLDRGLEGYATSALVFVVAARLARRRNDISKAKRLLAQAASLRPVLNVTQPGLAVQTYTEMARAYLELSDIAGARRVIREAQDILAQRPDLGLLPGRLDEVLGGLTNSSGRVGPSALTTAELRLLPLLTTHLTFPEIGERLFISRHTVKTQAMSIYRKLGASSRSEAVEAAHNLGLLGVSAEFTLPG